MRCDVTDRGVSSFEVVVSDELSELAFCILIVLVFGHLKFVLDCSEAGFCECIVVAVISAAHARTHCCSEQDLLVDQTCRFVYAAGATVPDRHHSSDNADAVL